MPSATPAVSVAPAADINKKKKKDLTVFGKEVQSDPDMQTPGPLNDFLWEYTEEPHLSRRKEIMKKYGTQIQKLYGYEWRTKYITAFLVALQIGLAVGLRDYAFTWQWWIITYVVGATANHALFLAIHEITHNLAFSNYVHNKYFAMFANLPICVPYSTQFKLYHQDHHKQQGGDAIDSDIPTKAEALIFNNVLMKALFCFTQILFYAFRPLFVKWQPLSFALLINWIVILTFDASLYLIWGVAPLAYLLASGFLAGSLHPCAGHFIAEHYVFVKGYETYSYYGPLNYLCFNVGYHNEHHDFPNIPWSRLPELRKIAPEFYDNLPYHGSWPRAIWEYITDPRVSAYSRVKRKAM